MQDPNIPTISKQFAMRYALKLDGLDRETVNILVPPTYEELDAKNKIILINNNDETGAEIDNIDEDHNTYLVMFERALDNETKDLAIERRKQALIMTGQNKKTDG